ncbi:MAG: EF-P lysine aminoacylase GenX [Deltaproteobacteria bacterium]|nr:MAG: EF-P lysine aminoacylase GenX [Deltaproteobacteria bacterium]
MDDILGLRGKISFEIRKFFIKRDYIEVETPIRLREIIPEEHIDFFTSENYYLQASPEICMKRLLSKGYKKIFQICKAFRKGERGNLHLPEITMLEWYHAGKTCFDLMDETRSLIQYLANYLNIEYIERQNKKIFINGNYIKLSIPDAVKKYTSYSFNEVLENFDEIFGLEICPNLGFERPVFLYDFPASQASLAALSQKNKDFAQRFELFIGGVEICNCFTELTDPLEQKKRFIQTINKRKNAGKEVSPVPQKFLRDLSLMPFSSGNALGVDRLIMLLLNQKKIDDVIAFPPEKL